MDAQRPPRSEEQGGRGPTDVGQPAFTQMTYIETFVELAPAGALRRAIQPS